MTVCHGHKNDTYFQPISTVLTATNSRRQLKVNCVAAFNRLVIFTFGNLLVQLRLSVVTLRLQTISSKFHYNLFSTASEATWILIFFFFEFVAKLFLTCCNNIWLQCLPMATFFFLRMIQFGNHNHCWHLAARKKGRKKQQRYEMRPFQYGEIARPLKPK